MDKELVREKLRGYAAWNEWELQEARERLPCLTMEEGFQQYLSLWRLARQLAPDAEEIFRERHLAHHVEVRAKFRRIAERMGNGIAG